MKRPKELFLWKPLRAFPLRRLLAERKMSIREVSRLTGIDRTLIQDYVRESVTPSWRAVCLLADALGLKLGDLDEPKKPRKGKVQRGRSNVPMVPTGEPD